ncbi:hypothetical protein T05_11655 [Trichinella murrelli]|uniref:Uncharacterized protein n=1 Tax=Trichinella murrelli TaxID=144512 RepID=A0A0V0TFC0_9BILA|nr:hypothetical protein T05_11655 [Trichinella murrelli]
MINIRQKNYKAQQIYSKQTLEPSWIFADVLLLLMLMYNAQLQNLSFISIVELQLHSLILLIIWLICEFDLINICFVRKWKMEARILSKPYRESKARLAALGKQTTENSQTYAFSNDLQNALT